MNRLLSMLTAILLLISYETRAMEEESRRISSQYQIHPKTESSDYYTRTLSLASSVANGLWNLCHWVTQNPAKAFVLTLAALPSVKATPASFLSPQMCSLEPCGDSPNVFPMATLCQQRSLEEASLRLTSLCEKFPSYVDSRFNVANLAAFRSDYYNPLALYLTDDFFRHTCIATESFDYKNPEDIPSTQVDFKNATRVEQGYYAIAQKGEILFTGSISNCVAVGISGKTERGQIRSFLAHVDQDAIDAMDQALARPSSSDTNPFGGMDDFISNHQDVNVMLVSGDITQLSYVGAFIDSTWDVPTESVYHRPWSATVPGEENEASQGTLVIKKGKFYLAKKPELVKRKMKKTHPTTGKPVPLKPISKFK
ncbi:MAG: hypothetical protein JSS34_02170 [Proteobacteria bacterium]|nr:hypothetical protein [Pseudomonadota bacterium]